MKSFSVALAATLIGMSASAQTPSDHAAHHGKPAASTEIGDWRKANERVGEIGGWKAYAREIEADQKARAAQTRSAPADRLLTAQGALAVAMQSEPALMQTLATLGSRGDADYLTLSHAQREALSRHAAIAAEVRRLYFSAVAAHERLIYQEQVTETFAIAAELSARMRRVGNLNALHQSEEQLAHAESVKSLAMVRARAQASREALIRRLNLSGEQAVFTLPDRLPQLPSSPRLLNPVEQRLIDDRSVAGPQWPSLVRAASEAREAIAEYERSYATAKHIRDDIIPLQRRISEEHLLHYNGMIIGIFELLKDARHQVKATESYMDALLAFWHADSALDARMTALKETAALARREAWTK